jgi:large subunit ribosomal protein L17
MTASLGSRKFHRERDQRRALFKNLADSLILNQSIETTEPKAKALVGYSERLITKAKKGDLHSRRQIIRALSTLEAAHKLVDDIAPKVEGRSSGYLRVERTGRRRGDGAQMAKVSFVDDLSKEVKQPKKSDKPKPKAKTTKKPAAKTAAKPAPRRAATAKRAGGKK